MDGGGVGGVKEVKFLVNYYYFADFKEGGENGFACFPYRDTTTLRTYILYIVRERDRERGGY